MDLNTKYITTKGATEDDISFHNALLHQSDIDLLKGPYWLNDNIIGFYFEYLENVTFKDNKRLLFIGPEVTQCIKMRDWQEMPTFLDPLHFRHKDFVFFAVNDCDLKTYVPKTKVRRSTLPPGTKIIDVPGGSHWSLLVLSKPENLFCHLDSLAGANNAHAWQIGTNVSKYMRKEIDFTEIECLQQKNSYDCGIHILCMVDQLANHCNKKNKLLGAGHLQRSSIEAKRNHLLQLIRSVQQTHNSSNE